MRLVLLVFVLFISVHLVAQKQNNIWCFGDSAGIDFNNINNPQPYSSVIRSKGSCVSICDTSGNLICYAATSVPHITPADTFNVKVFNRNNQLLINGDSIIGLAWYYELVLLPSPGQSNIFYLFCIGVTDNYGLYYSVIDMNQNGGLGAVVQKNIQLLNYQCSDGLSAVKHANGRDWWVLFRRGYLPTNEFYIYLVSPAGIQGPNIYALGSLSNSNILRQIFSPDGSKLMILNYAGLIELFDFDRCTGIPSNPLTIDTEYCCPYPAYWSGEFSPYGRYFYLGNTLQDSCYLIQLDLQATNIMGSSDTLYSFNYPPSYYSEGVIKRGPDNKIYVANGYYNGVQNFYPYQDSMYNMYNMNISVINSPDSPGIACNFQPYSFYLGGKRSYLGLPNNPDYDLGPIAGSICDSLSNSIIQPLMQNINLNVYYHSSWQVAFINAQKISGKNYSLIVYDVSGKQVFQESGRLASAYYTKNLNCEGYANGIYIVSFMSDREKLVKRFVKE